MREVKIFSKLKTINNFLSGIATNQPSHAYMLTSADEQTLSASAIVLALNLTCVSNSKPCFECANCKKILNGTSVDVFSYPKGTKQNIVVDDVKEIIETCQSKPLDFDKKIYILNNCGNSTIPAQNKLLKILEEPPKNVIFIITAISSKAVLATISSRVKTLAIPLVNTAELKEVLKIQGVDAVKLQIACESSEGYLGKAFEILNNQAYFEIYNFMLDLLSNMTNTKRMVEYSYVFVKNQKFISIYLEIMQNMFRDLLVIKTGASELVINKFSLNALVEISNDYSELAIIKIINKIIESKKMLKHNTNFIAVIDALLVNVLEVKHRWK